MKQIVVALFAGALFGAGLAFSGMADPARVQGFLDLFGAWDPTLAFVMGGAMIPMALAWIIQRKLDKPLADAHFSLPATTLIDRKLTIGAILFGTGWGISGLCPGPGLADLAINPFPALAFVAALLAGMLAHRATS
ncbi:DUF6691 family protein [Parasphingorhabdus sp.]|uniref:DUF6691 family protein n=1 Tax=Parasphingorhabdus sp. TaxID=2709688 RepID=UPI003A90C1EC